MARKRTSTEPPETGSGSFVFDIDPIPGQPAKEAATPAQSAANPPSSASPAPAPAPKAEAATPETLTVRLRPGTMEIDWDSMRDATQARAKALLAANGAAVAEAQAAILPEHTTWIFAALGSMESWLAQRKGVPKEVADKAFTYSEAEVSALAGPTARVLTKYVPASAAKYKDEAELVMLLAVIHQSKIAMIQAEMKKRNEPEKPKES
jgi:hypothetical protein